MKQELISRNYSTGVLRERSAGVLQGSIDVEQEGQIDLQCVGCRVLGGCLDRLGRDSISGRPLHTRRRGVHSPMYAVATWSGGLLETSAYHLDRVV